MCLLLLLVVIVAAILTHPSQQCVLMVECGHMRCRQLVISRYMSLVGQKGTLQNAAGMPFWTHQMPGEAGSENLN